MASGFHLSEQTINAQVAHLWAGYGSIERITAVVAGRKASLVVKHINPPPPDGSVGDHRCDV
jgi:hypothetical protein